MLRNAQYGKTPILVVCYTNHALDQFLEGILEFCSEIIRIGGKSQSEKLEQFNIAKQRAFSREKRKVPQHIYITRKESFAVLEEYQKILAEIEKKIDEASRKICAGVFQVMNPHIVERISTEFENIHGGPFNAKKALEMWLQCDGVVYKERAAVQQAEVEVAEEALPENAEEFEGDENEIRELEEARLLDEEELFEMFRAVHLNNEEEAAALEPNGEDEEGFRMDNRQMKALRQRVQRELRRTDAMPQNEVNAVTNVFNLAIENRWQLYRHWLQSYISAFEEQAFNIRRRYMDECVKFESIKRQEDLHIVSEAKVIGMTTTGAAKYRHLVEGTRPAISSKVPQSILFTYSFV